MDTPCHALTGFVVGKAVQSEEEGVERPGPLFTTLASLLPDADFFIRWFGMSTYLTYHRAFLNSVFLLPPLILLFSAAVWWYRRRASLRSYLLVGLLVGGIHIFMDLWNTFGSPIFFPFSFDRYAFDLVFIIDLFVYAFLLVPIAGRVVQSRWSPALARSSFVLITGYLLFSGVQQYYAFQQLEGIRERMGRSESAVLRTGVTPQPLLPFHWSLIVQRENGSRQRFVNTLTGRRYAQDDQFERNQEAFALLERGKEYDRDARVFDWFARYPVVLRQTEQEMLYGDLQFNVKVYDSVRNALVGEEESRTLPFRFRCILDGDGPPDFEWVGEED